MPLVRVNLNINRDEMLRWYSGGAHHVNALALDGRRVQFPVDLIRPYITHDGVQGAFEIEFSPEGKFQSIRRL